MRPIDTDYYSSADLVVAALREECAEFVGFRIFLCAVRPRACADTDHGEMERRTPPDEEIRAWPGRNLCILHADLPEVGPLLAMACRINKVRRGLSIPSPD